MAAAWPPRCQHEWPFLPTKVKFGFRTVPRDPLSLGILVYFICIVALTVLGTVLIERFPLSQVVLDARLERVCQPIIDRRRGIVVVEISGALHRSPVGQRPAATDSGRDSAIVPLASLAVDMLTASVADSV